MNKRARALCVALLLGGGGATAAETETEVMGPLLCAIIEIKECIRGEECLDVMPEEVNAPPFFRIDAEAGQLVAREVSGDVRVSPIKRVERLNGKLMLQGVEPTSTLDPDGVGWTISVNESNGRMVGSASGTNTGMVLFGSCTLI